MLVYHPAAPGCCWVIVSESDLWLEDKFSSFGGQKQRESGQLLNHFCTEKMLNCQHLPGRNEAPGGGSAGC